MCYRFRLICIPYVIRTFQMLSGFHIFDRRSLTSNSGTFYFIRRANHTVLVSHSIRLTICHRTITKYYLDQCQLFIYSMCNFAVDFQHRFYVDVELKRDDHKLNGKNSFYAYSARQWINSELFSSYKNCFFLRILITYTALNALNVRWLIVALCVHGVNVAVAGFVVPNIYINSDDGIDRNDICCSCSNILCCEASFIWSLLSNIYINKKKSKLLFRLYLAY